MELWSDEEVTQFRALLYQYVKKCDEQARSQIAEMFYGKAFCMIGSRVPDYEDRCQVAIDATVWATTPVALKGLAQRDEPNPDWHLSKAVNWFVANYWKKRAREQPVEPLYTPDPETGEWVEREMESPEPTPEEVLLEEEKKACIRRCIEQQPPTYRDILWLVYGEEGLSEKEAGERLGISHSAARQRVSRALRVAAFRRCLARCLGWEEGD
jgi:RNA polymerase sigma factor (sigma-70 family)